MSHAPPIRLPSRRDPAVALVARHWRQLTTPGTRPGSDGERRTLIACSGGVDSSALAIVLRVASGRTDNLALAHIVHDLRPAADARADRDATRRLAEELDLPFHEAEIRVRTGTGNAESRARRARYAALAEIARERGFPSIATAHHARDQLESLLMALVRGAGPTGMRGIAPQRTLAAADGPLVRLIRPMLHLDADEARRLCVEAGWAWREDATNTDTTRLRAAIRAEVLPTLTALRPAAAKRAADTAELMRALHDHLEAAASSLLAEAGRVDGPSLSLTWSRAVLRQCSAAVLAEMLRLAVRRDGGGRGLDRLPARALHAAARAIVSPSGEARRFPWRAVELRVDRETVTLSFRDPAGEGLGP